MFIQVAVWAGAAIVLIYALATIVDIIREIIE